MHAITESSKSHLLKRQVRSHNRTSAQETSKPTPTPAPTATPLPPPLTSAGSITSRLPDDLRQVAPRFWTSMARLVTNAHYSSCYDHPPTHERTNERRFQPPIPPSDFSLNSGTFRYLPVFVRGEGCSRLASWPSGLGSASSYYWPVPPHSQFS